MDADNMAEARAGMVRQLALYKIRDERVLKAMAKVRRHVFIPALHRKDAAAYGDHPCAIGYGQTISQPFIVAYMTERMDVQPGAKVLEIGAGSGYQAAILAELGACVYSVELIPDLAEHAKQTLAAEGYGPGRVQILCGDGYAGWPEHAPFDIIMATCAPDVIPDRLVDQLAEGGRLILPLGAFSQRLVVLRKKQDKVETEEDLPVRFVPMVHGLPCNPRDASQTDYY
mgnify:CR=1 FL=1